MKIRISGNSIRFRLKQSEVRRFVEDGMISEVTTFGVHASQKLSFVLKQAMSRHFLLAYDANTLTVELPNELCTSWAQTDLVGFDETIELGNGESLFVLVEKDFKCLDGADIADEDAYPNPHMEC